MTAWLRGRRSGRAGGRTLVCFPHAGGSAEFYLALLRALDPAIAVTVVQYPGRGDRRDEPSLSSVEELAERVAPLVDELPGEELFLFGHSMGALVGYEVAVRLRRQIGRLFVSGHAPPSSAPRTGPLGDLGDEDLVDHLRHLGGTDEILLRQPWLMELFLPGLRHDLSLARSHLHRPVRRLVCPITALVGASDPLVGPDDLYAWSALTDGPLRLAVVPGGHFYFTQQAAELLRILARDMTGAAQPVAAN
jgi:surfactin synthase thioesterase subunit